MKECCQKEENLVIIEKKEDVTVRQCTECGCRHFEVVFEPGHLGVEIKPL